MVTPQNHTTTVSRALCCYLAWGYVPGDGDTLGVAVLGGDGLLQLIQLSSLLQLLHQALDSLLTPLLLLAILFSTPCSPGAAGWLLPPQEPLHDRRGERQDGGHFGCSEEESWENKHTLRQRGPGGRDAQFSPFSGVVPLFREESQGWCEDELDMCRRDDTWG